MASVNDLPPVRFARTSDGVSIAYSVWPGKSPPFLAVTSPASPPVSISAAHTRQILLPFAGNRSVVRFDFRGAGKSDRVLAQSAHDFVIDLEAVTNTIGEPVDVVLLGAMSCFPVCQFAACEPPLWRSLMLIDVTVRQEDNYLSFVTRPGWDEDYAAQLRLVSRSMGYLGSISDAEEHARRWAQEVPKETFATYQRVLAGYDLSTTLPLIQLPVLVTNAMQPGLDPRVAALLPNGILVERDSSERGDPIQLRALWDRCLGVQFEGSSARIDASTNGRLTLRENEVLGLLAGGATNTAIASRLALSEKTVARHVSNIYAKIDVHNRVEATRWALEHGVK